MSVSDSPSSDTKCIGFNGPCDGVPRICNPTNGTWMCLGCQANHDREQIEHKGRRNLEQSLLVVRTALMREAGVGRATFADGMTIDLTAPPVPDPRDTERPSDPGEPRLTPDGLGIVVEGRPVGPRRMFVARGPRPLANEEPDS